MDRADRKTTSKLTITRDEGSADHDLASLAVPRKIYAATGFFAFGAFSETKRISTRLLKADAIR